MPSQKNLPPTREKLNNYARYTGVAFQMIIIILAGVYGGIKTDKWLNTGKPVFTAIFSLLGVVIAIYTVIKDLIKK
jgi:ATP synthase protein I